MRCGTRYSTNRFKAAACGSAESDMELLGADFCDCAETLIGGERFPPAPGHSCEYVSALTLAPLGSWSLNKFHAMR